MLTDAVIAALPEEFRPLAKCVRDDLELIPAYRMGCTPQTVAALLVALAEARTELERLRREGCAPEGKALVGEADLRDLIDCGCNPNKRCHNCRLLCLCKNGPDADAFSPTSASRRNRRRRPMATVKVRIADELLGELRDGRCEWTGERWVWVSMRADRARGGTP
jgi:hypothetical protein